MKPKQIIAIKGAGEMATGVAWQLFQANCTHIFMVEIENPVAVRRQVSFCEAIHDGTILVEGVRAQKVLDIRDNTRVRDQMKIGDIDPRGNLGFFTTISDKARAIGGGVLEAVKATRFPNV